VCFSLIAKIKTSSAMTEAKTPGVKEETHDKNDEIVKYETMTFWGFRYQKLEESRVETLHHRSPKVVK
jgi:hypothetical protein